MATKFYYPAFMRKAKALDTFLARHQKDMVALNNITGSELTELQALATALDQIVGESSTWPGYRYIL